MMPVALFIVGALIFLGGIDQEVCGTKPYGRYEGHALLLASVLTVAGGLIYISEG